MNLGQVATTVSPAVPASCSQSGPPTAMIAIPSTDDCGPLQVSEFELGVLRARMLDAARSKARRGELRLSVPFGYVWHRDLGLGFDPDLRLQEVIRLIFTRFHQLGSARQVLLSMTADRVHFPRPSDEGRMTSFEWKPIRYRNVISVLKNPFYAGVYVYGKSEKRTEIIDGRARKSYGHGKPTGTWEVMIKDHHDSYISWAEYERNQKQLAINAYGQPGGTKSGRGGRALLSGLLTCGRCGRRLAVAYTGNPLSRPVYRCDKPNLMMGLPRCMTFGGPRVDAAVSRELLRAVEPMAIEAALEAERMHRERQDEQHRILDLELQQARYEANLAERRYAACDPDNRLIAAQLEKNWETALRRVQELEARRTNERRETVAVDPTVFAHLADNLSTAWNAPGVTMRARQQFLRALIVNIVVDVDDQAREVVLIIHWRGGQHSELRVRKPRTGEHGCATTDDALAVMRSMAGRWSDEHIAASLNRMGIPCRRATSETCAPATNDSATIRAFASADQRRRRPVPVITSNRRRPAALGSSVWSSIWSNRSCQDRNHPPLFGALVGGDGAPLTLEHRPRVDRSWPVGREDSSKSGHSIATL
jgi:hypothetical protein